MPRIVLLLTFLFFASLLNPALVGAQSTAGEAQAPESPCWFLRESKITLPAETNSILIDDYFRIFYVEEPGDLKHLAEMFTRAHHFLQTELGWKLPATRLQLGHPELYVYFLKGLDEFQGTTVTRPELSLIFNKDVVSRSDFPAIFIHQFAHASELQYRTSGDYWFFEATAGWMEAQFDLYSARTRDAIATRLARPGTSLIDPSPVLALGASRFLDFLSRPYKDVVRQIWERWSDATEEPLLQIIQEVLSLNHLPDFGSYLQNYFLLFVPEVNLENEAVLTIRPYSAAVFEGEPPQASGGMRFLFTPERSANYSTSFIFYGAQQKQGALSMRNGLTGPWSLSVPFSGLDHYKLVIGNPTATELRGRIQGLLDNTIPAVLEYFRVNPMEGGVQIEWKTSRENGVSFWNLYSIRNGQKRLINDYPIPAATQSGEGIHYLYFDTSTSALYSLEAITNEGFRSPVADAEKRR